MNLDDPRLNPIRNIKSQVKLSSDQKEKIILAMQETARTKQKIKPFYILAIASCISLLILANVYLLNKSITNEKTQSNSGNPLYTEYFSSLVPEQLQSHGSN